MSFERDMDVFHRLKTRDDYRTLLQAHFGDFDPIEGLLRLSAATGAPDDFHRAERLTRDLRALGMSDAEIDALPRCPALPPLRSVGEITGCRYVLEGSALGGQIIYRPVRERRGGNEQASAAFFRGEGEASRRR